MDERTLDPMGGGDDAADFDISRWFSLESLSYLTRGPYDSDFGGDYVGACLGCFLG
jgi:hypothetical protein